MSKRTKLVILSAAVLLAVAVAGKLSYDTAFPSTKVYFAISHAR